MLGLSPNVSNKNTQVLRYSTAMREPRAPLLLIRFDERKYAVTFTDASGIDGGQRGRLHHGALPHAGLAGALRQRRSLQRRGSIPDHSAQPGHRPDDPEFHPLGLGEACQADRRPGSDPDRPGGPNGTGGVTFGLSDANLFLRFKGGGPSFVQPAPSPIRLNEWNHITMESYFGTLYYSVNGVDGQGGSHARVASINPQIVIGAAQQPSSNTEPDQGSNTVIPLIQVEHFAGAIDDVLIRIGRLTIPAASRPSSPGATTQTISSCAPARR